MLYKGDHTREISFPIGGIGTGCIGLGGNGHLIDWEIFNRPNKGALNGFTSIVIKLKKQGKTYIKVLCADTDKDLSGKTIKGQGGQRFGIGISYFHMQGYPHFKNCEFNGEFPIAELTFTDDDFPGSVILRAFNPFIPLDSFNSSLPAGFFEVIYKNNDNEPADFTVSFNLSNPYSMSKHYKVENGSIKSVQLINDIDKEEIEYGELALTCKNPSLLQTYWYRGNWFDGISTFWSEFSEQKPMEDRVYNDPPSKTVSSSLNIKDTCSIIQQATINPGEEKGFKYALSWYVPNCTRYWSPVYEGDDNKWKNYYATVFKSAAEVGSYCVEKWDELYEKTMKFKNELFSSTVDDAIKDAISGTVCVLKSPTVSRLEDGSFYGFEGSNEISGSCEGTCQHVYNYAYAMCFLFPDLERSIRDLEFKYTTTEHGKTKFRIDLPLRKPTDEYRSCLDGHMGCVIKSYREWKISGDDSWLKQSWPTITRIMDFAWSEHNKDEWDRNKDGVLEGRQHHTLDMELFGPSSWLQGFYLAALKAAGEMAEYLGDTQKYNEYMDVYNKGREWTERNLFNGEYFVHKIDLTDKSIPEHFGCSDRYWNEETGQIKYQIENGCSIDQLTGQWHADICGLGDIFRPSQVKTAVRSMYKYNFKKSMRDVINMWRIFALNDEAGAIMCDYPEGAPKPIIHITYCEECMTGFEYVLAGLLIKQGMYNEGLELVKAVRDRYDGKKRNPWNELECGSNYVRPMSSYALLNIISGLSFDMPKGEIGFAPIDIKDSFRCMFSLGTGWGNVVTDGVSTKITLNDGYLDIQKLSLPYMNKVNKVIIDGKETEFKVLNGNIIFDRTKINSYVEIK